MYISLSKETYYSTKLTIKKIQNIKTSLLRKKNEKLIHVKFLNAQYIYIYIYIYIYRKVINA